MNAIWNGIGATQSAGIAASGTANAIYFARRAAQARGGRRVAAAVLVGLFAGVAIEGAGTFAANAGAAGEVLSRAPLFAATLATSALLRLGARR